MKTSIVSGVGAPRASELKSEWGSSQVLRKRLIELLEKKQETSLKKRRKEDIYDSPNFALLQADQIGYERAISEIIALLE
jgi:hypothetical protein